MQVRELLAPAPEYTSEEWRNHYKDHPDVVLDMLGGIFRVYRAQEQKRAGKGNPSGGRRKRAVEGSIDELFSIITPRLSMEPFPQAYAELFPSPRTLRQVAMRSGIPHQALSCKLRGTRPVTRSDLERLAQVADVHPAYFREWRAMALTDMVTSVFEAHPNLSVTMLRKLATK